MYQALVFLLLISTSSLAKAKPIVIAISDFPPSIDLSDENYGIHGELILGALREADQPFEIKIYSWTKIKQMLDTQDICSFGWVKNQERQKRWQYSRPYHADISYLWGRKDNPIKLNSVEDALKYSIGVTRGFSYGQEFDDLLTKASIDESFDDTVNLRKLLAGRIDLFPGQALIIRPILASRFTDQADQLEPKIVINNLSHHFVCNIDSQLGKEVIQKINPLLPNVEEIEINP